MVASGIFFLKKRAGPKDRLFNEKLKQKRSEGKHELALRLKMATVATGKQHLLVVAPPLTILVQ